MFYRVGLNLDHSGPAKLINAKLSTLRRENYASYAIDGDASTKCITDCDDPNKDHWVTVSMDLVTVQQVTLKAQSYKWDGNQKGVYPITVSLYKGSVLAGTCADHPGDDSTVILSCERVEADLVKMGLIVEGRVHLVVFEVEEVMGDVTVTLGKIKDIQYPIRGYNYSMGKIAVKII